MNTSFRQPQLRHPHKTLQRLGYHEHHSLGGHTIWVEGYARAGYFQEHHDEHHNAWHRAQEWKQKRDSSPAPKRQTHLV